MHQSIKAAEMIERMLEMYFNFNECLALFSFQTNHHFNLLLTKTILCCR